MKKIMVVGIGGVGGVLAANLVKKYGADVSLVARGKRKEALQQNGLTLHSDLYGEFTVRPACVEQDPAACGVQDLILICVKNDALAKVCVGKFRDKPTAQKTADDLKKKGIAGFVITI